jgi:hypothetical protein
MLVSVIKTDYSHPQISFRGRRGIIGRAEEEGNKCEESILVILTRMKYRIVYTEVLIPLLK